MGSVSTVALAAVATAQAADLSAGVVEAPAVPQGFTVSIEGGALFGVNTLAEDKLGPIDSAISASGGTTELNIEDILGYRGAISLGKQLDPNWDVKAAIAANQQLTATSDFSAFFSGGSSGSSTSLYGTLKNSLNYETFDFEVGYRPTLSDNFDVRLFGGLRGLHYKDSVDKTGTETFYVASGGSGGTDKVGIAGGEEDYAQEFLGVGPRIGVEGSTRFGDSMFGVSGLLAGSAIFGVARTEGSVSYFIANSGGSGGSFSYDLPGNEESTVVYDLEAALGLDVHLDEATTLTLGYRAEGLFGLNNSVSGGSGTSGGDARWTHGPTLKLTGYFD
jgi:hypothetical protein